jgi:hypothetical protein
MSSINNINSSIPPIDYNPDDPDSPFYVDPNLALNAAMLQAEEAVEQSINNNDTTTKNDTTIAATQAQVASPKANFSKGQLRQMNSEVALQQAIVNAQPANKIQGDTLQTGSGKSSTSK